VNIPPHEPMHMS